MIYKLAKASCLIVYLLALAGLAGLLPSDLAGSMKNIALAMLLIHTLELALAFKYVRRYRGPLAVSVLLTMLFGLLHWKPLVKLHD
jgi:uncharacterized protein YhhL (DUF1145 family)